MRTGSLLLAAAALTLSALPAQAQHSSTMSSNWTSKEGTDVRIHRGPDAHRGGDRHWRDEGPSRGGDWRWRGRSDVIVYDSGVWALYNNRSWEEDSFNDWFQENESRSLPRWVQNNKDCKRIYWSGGGWTC